MVYSWGQPQPCFTQLPPLHTVTTQSGWRCSLQCLEHYRMRVHQCDCRSRQQRLLQGGDYDCTYTSDTCCEHGFGFRVCTAAIKSHKQPDLRRLVLSGKTGHVSFLVSSFSSKPICCELRIFTGSWIICLLSKLGCRFKQSLCSQQTSVE